MLRITARSSKYSYVISPKDARIIKLTGGLGLIATWFLAWGYYHFLEINLFIKIGLSIPFLIVVLYHAIAYLLQLLYPGFDIEKHNARVVTHWKEHSEPKVTVVIPAAGESVATVRKTILGALAITYTNKQVFLLDDTPHGMYRKLCSRLGCGYMKRPNTGECKKAGNLNYALEYLPPSDYLLVLDADFVPRQEMLREMVPYALDDVAIVQTPQHFSLSDAVYAKSKIAFGAGLMQKEFYRTTQVARDRFGSAICVGTNALYRRAALMEVGGYQGVGGYGPWQHSEDVNTGLKLLNFIRQDGKPYRIRYLPVQLATGTCPDTYYAFYKQQNRWCTGSLQLLFSQKTLFSRVLTPLQKLFYFSNGLYYLYTIAILLAPLQLITICLMDATYQWGYTFYFLPSLAMLTIIVPYVYRREPEPLAFMVTIIATAFTFMQALYLLIIRRPLGWEATGQKLKGKNIRFNQLRYLVALYNAGLIAGFALVLHDDGFGFRSTIVLQLLFVMALISHTVHLFYLVFVTMGTRKLSYLSLRKKMLPSKYLSYTSGRS